MSSLRSDSNKATLEATKEKKKNATMSSDLSHSRDELAQYKAGEEQHWEVRKKEFLISPEFHELVDTQTDFLFDLRFLEAVKQFKKARYPPDGAPTDFLNPDAALVEISNSQFKD